MDEKKFVCPSCGHEVQAAEMPATCPACGAPMKPDIAPGTDVEGEEMDRS